LQGGCVQPASIAIALRRRSPWESIDLGLSMLQRWWRPVYFPHLLIGGLAAVLAMGLAFALEKPWVAVVLVWWLKPLYDRVVLHVLSRAVFGEHLDARAVLAAAKEWLGTGLFMALSFGRFSLSRSFNLPVRQLEGQKGSEGRKRRAVLGRRARSYAVWLTVVCLHFEVVLLWSLQLLVDLLQPAKAAAGHSVWELLFSGSGDAEALWSYGDALAYACAVLLFEPFYVAAGFALYLNRRTLLEGWDIEVALRRLAERHAVPALLLICITSVLAWAQPAQAQEKNAREQIAEVLKDPEFPHYKEEMRWQRRSPLKQAASKSTHLDGIGYALAKAAEVLFWMLVAAAAGYALWWLARRLPSFASPPREAYQPPAALFGMELAPDSLPHDVPGAAAALAREGKLRQALSLLYRGALSELVYKRGVRLLASHTEIEVLGIANNPFLETLVPAWRESAYAKRDPSALEIANLAENYRAAFA
jgi:hypothetical protein